MSSEAIPAKEHPFALLRSFQLCHMDVIRKTAYVLLFMLAGFALARTQLILQMSPFGPAFVAACFFSRRSESLFAAAAVCLGALLVPQNTLFVVTVTLLLCAALIAVGQNRQKRWVVLMSMACAYIVGAAVFKTASLATYLPALIECLVSMVIFYVLSTLIDIGTRGSRRSLFSAEETICLALGALVLVCMLGPINIWGIYIAYIAAQLMVLFAAYAGGTALGAGVGLALGLALFLSVSAEVAAIGMIGLAGMLTGTIRKLGRLCSAACFILANLLFIAAFYTVSVWYLVLIESGAAALIFVLLPRRIFLFAGRFIDIKTRHEFEYNLHIRRLKQLTAGRLEEVSKVFVQTGDMFARQSCSKVPGNAHIYGALSAIAETTCNNCVFKKSCWDRDFLATYSFFTQLFVTFERDGRIELSEAAPAFAKKCFNIKGVLATAQSVFAASLLNLKWQKKINDICAITGQQLKGVARVVADLGCEIDTGIKFLPAVEERVACALDTMNMHVKEVCAQTMGGGMVIGIKMRGSGVQGINLERAVSGACGVTMKKTAEEEGHAAYRVLKFEQACKFCVETGAASAAKSEISGDSFFYSTLNCGRYLVVLCDGMGSGEAARQESSAAVSLIENFFRAGFDDKVVFEIINKILMLRGNSDVFSTVDLCVLDCKTGEARFTKTGAECAYILNEEGVAAVSSGALPIGIVEEVMPRNTSMTLMEKDMVVMLSDGVADGISGDPVKWFADIPKDNAQQTADAILEKALAGGVPPDDMTVLVSLVAKA